MWYNIYIKLRQKGFVKMKKIISKVFTILLIMFFVLLGFSYIDTITHNNPANENYGDYSKMNIIVQLYE